MGVLSAKWSSQLPTGVVCLALAHCRALCNVMHDQHIPISQNLEDLELRSGAPAEKINRPEPDPFSP